MTKALIVVDVQPTFCEGGELGVEGGKLGHRRAEVPGAAGLEPPAFHLRADGPGDDRVVLDDEHAVHVIR